MKKRLILLVLACVLGGIGVQAQRPVGDTLLFYDNSGDYLYSTIYQNTAYDFSFFNNEYGIIENLDSEFNSYKNLIRYWNSTQMTLDEFLHLYPDMAAGTHNNNGAVWSSVASDTVYDTPRECRDTTFTHYIDPYYIWVKYDSMPWYRPNVNRIKTPMNIFSILDTLFGTPCATVRNLQAVAVYDLSGRRVTEQVAEGCPPRWTCQPCHVAPISWRYTPCKALPPRSWWWSGEKLG